MKKITVFLLILFTLFFVCSAVQAAELPRWGPYITSDNDTSVTIHYRLYDETAGGVEISGPDGTEVIELEPSIFHHAKIDGLRPDTQYSYRILVNGAYSDTFRFKTPGAENYTFVISGDTRSEPPFTQIERHGVVAAGILKEEPLFVVHLGDFCGEANDIKEWDQFFEAGRELYANTIIVPVQGNHDKSELYPEIFGKENWYSFDTGKTRMLILNTNPWVNKYFNEQTAWLENELDSDKLTFAFFHHPFYTTDAKISGLSVNQRNEWKKLFAGSIPAAFSAHMHAYERYRADGIYYVTNGAGGAPLYSPDTAPEIKADKTIYHTLGYLLMTITGKNWHAEFIRLAEVTDDNSEIIREYGDYSIADSFDNDIPVQSPIHIIPIIAGLTAAFILWRKT